MRYPTPYFNEQETMDKLEQYRSSLHLDDESSATHAKMVEEVEKVSEILLDTRNKLWTTQDILKASQETARLLQIQLEVRDTDMEAICTENELLQGEKLKMQDEMYRLQLKMKQNDSNRHPIIERLQTIVEVLDKDLFESRESLAVSQMQVESQKSQIDLLTQSNHMFKARIEQLDGIDPETSNKLSSCQEELKEAKLEAMVLFEEVAALREELRCQKLNTEQRDDSRMREEYQELKHEVAQLKEMLEASRQERETSILNVESTYKLQIQAIQEEHAKEMENVTSEIRLEVVKEREKELDDLKLISTEADRLLTEEAEEALERAVKEKVKKEEEILSLNDEIEKINLALSDSNTQIDNLHQDLSKARAQSEAADSKLESLRKELEISQDEVLDLQNEVQILRIHLDQYQSSHEQGTEKLGQSGQNILGLTERLNTLKDSQRTSAHDRIQRIRKATDDIIESTSPLQTTIQNDNVDSETENNETEGNDNEIMSSKETPIVSSKDNSVAEEELSLAEMIELGQMIASNAQRNTDSTHLDPPGYTCLDENHAEDDAFSVDINNLELQGIYVDIHDEIDDHFNQSISDAITFKQSPASQKEQEDTNDNLFNPLSLDSNKASTDCNSIRLEEKSDKDKVELATPNELSGSPSILYALRRSSRRSSKTLQSGIRHLKGKRVTSPSRETILD